jgi:hypothetical protein
MKQYFIKCSIVATVAAIGYTASFVVVRFAKPEFVNTNDGPKAAFKSFYYPLCYISASRPIWHSRVRDGWLEIQIDWINRGNGYLYFIWDGYEARASYSADLHNVKEHDVVLAHFGYELMTWDDFSSHLVPYIDKVKPANQGAAIAASSPSVR